MITDEMLRRAAVISSDAFVRSAEEKYREEHVFSAEFEKKIRKLYLRANHPYLYRLMRQVASVLLALLIGGSVWLTVDEEARAAFFGWVKEVYETAVWYCSGGGRDASAERKEYYIPVLPEGYEEVLMDAGEDGKLAVYRNDRGQYLQFYYRLGMDVSGLLTGNSTAEYTKTTIGGNPTDLIISCKSDISSSIMWTTKDGTVFQISGFLSAEELIALAESIEEVS